MAKKKKRKITKKAEKLNKKILRRAQDIRSAKRRKVLVKKTKKQKPRKKLLKKKIRKVLKLKKTKKLTRRIVRKVKAKKVVKKILKIKKVSVRKIKRSATRKVKNNIAKKSEEVFSAESLFKAKIKVIGIGGGGGSIVSEIGRSLEKATFVIADTDIRALKKRSGIKYFWFGEDLTHGLGTGVNVDLAKQAAESAKEKISAFFKDQDIIIFVASLGGGLGSGATQVFAEAAREFGGITLGIFTMPFKFEGKNKYRIAQNALKSLRKSLNVSLVIPNEKIFKVIDESTPITNAFSTVNKSLIESLESLIDLIYNPGIINIDFADLRTILKGRGNSAFLNTVEESGKNRVEKTCENIFRNPLLQNSGFTAEKILFNIAGAESLPMFEVEKISSHIANLNPKAKIIFGISKNSKLKNKIKTTILMTGGQIKEEISKEAAIKKAESVKVDVEKQAVVKNDNKKVKIKGRAKKHTKKQPQKERLAGKKNPNRAGGQEQVSSVPALGIPEPSLQPLIPVLDQRKLNVIQEPGEYSAKKTIRRSGLEIKKAEELEEKKRLAQEKEWEIPAFLRKIKFKS